MLAVQSANRGSHQVGQTAGASGWVNAPYTTYIHNLWDAITAPAPKVRKARVTPRGRPEAERAPLRRRQTPGEKAFGVQPQKIQSKIRPPTPKEAPKSVPKYRDTLSAPPRSASPSRRKPKARTQRDQSPQIQQPAWDSRGPPRRAPGEIVNKYNHRGTLGDRASLAMRPTGGDPSAAGGSTMTVQTERVPDSRVTSSPSGKMHPNPDRRFELRQSDMFTNINYFSPGGAPDNDRKMKESSWISSQAWFESLRYYPKGMEAAKNEDCEATFSGNTHGSTVPAEHIQNDVRNRVGIAPADPGWMPHQVPEPWAPEMEARMKSLAVSSNSSVTRLPKALQ